MNPKGQRTKHIFLTILILNHQDNPMRLNRVCDESVQFLVEDSQVYNKLWMEGFYWKMKHRWGPNWKSHSNLGTNTFFSLF